MELNTHARVLLSMMEGKEEGRERVNEREEEEREPKKRGERTKKERERQKKEKKRRKSEVGPSGPHDAPKVALAQPTRDTIEAAPIMEPRKVFLV
jgi:hypothetical protein